MQKNFWQPFRLLAHHNSKEQKPVQGTGFPRKGRDVNDIIGIIII